MKGHWDLDTGLWRINLSSKNKQTQIYKAINVYELRNTDKLVNYLQKALLSPTKPALLRGIKRSPRKLARSHGRHNKQSF